MLTGNLVRVRQAKNKIVPLYVSVQDRGLLDLAEQFLFAFRSAPGRTRGEILQELSELIGEGPRALIPRGLFDLLEDRCEFEISSDHPPDDLRELVFRSAVAHRQAVAKAGSPFDRSSVIAEVAGSLQLAPEQVERGLFADLKDERRVLEFKDTTAEQLLHRYNEALAQAILLRCTSMETRIWGESPARFRQLFRKVKFHKLICTIHESAGSSYTLQLDGPLSLFSSTNKYGLQLAHFLPTILHCKAFDLKANIRWGAERKDKLFTLNSNDGLRSHLADFGVYTPPELQMFAESFRTKIKGWAIDTDPNPITLTDGIWVPDFKISQTIGGRDVYVEIFGFWRRGDIDTLFKRLNKQIPGRFILCIAEQYRTDEGDEEGFREGIYHFKRTPLPEEVVKIATAISGSRA